jgi:hypothetical protein
MFTAGTLETLYAIYGWDATSAAYRKIVVDKMTAIETINPSVVAKIEQAIADLETKTADFDPSDRYLTKLGPIGWNGGQGMGTVAEIVDLKLSLLGLLGLTGFTGRSESSGDGFERNGATFTRSDYLSRSRSWYRRMAY